MDRPTLELKKVGQGVWYGDLGRERITNGDLQRVVREDGVSGGIFNTAAFEEALTETGVYNEELQALAKQGKMLGQMYDGLTVPDLQRGADMLRPVYEETDGVDGYVSLEVSPLLAPLTEKTAEEAGKLWAGLDRPNAMIGIPGTQLGLPAVEQCLRERLNVNVTLLFGQDQYEQAAWTYVSALEQCLVEGQPVERIASVASFVVGRVDSRVDVLLQKKISAARGEAQRAKLSALLGKAGIANSKLAHAKFREIFTSPRWQALAARGARVQRCVWVGTEPSQAYADVMYVEPLIGPDTVNVMSQATLDAFRDHGRVAPTLEDGLAEARETMAGLAEAGIDLRTVTDRLQVRAIEALGDSYEKAVEALDSRAQVVW